MGKRLISLTMLRCNVEAMPLNISVEIYVEPGSFPFSYLRAAKMANKTYIVMPFKPLKQLHALCRQIWANIFGTPVLRRVLYRLHGLKYSTNFYCKFRIELERSLTKAKVDVDHVPFGKRLTWNADTGKARYSVQNTFSIFGMGILTSKAFGVVLNVTICYLIPGLQVRTRNGQVHKAYIVGVKLLAYFINEMVDAVWILSHGGINALG